MKGLKELREIVEKQRAAAGERQKTWSKRREIGGAKEQGPENTKKAKQLEEMGIEEVKCSADAQKKETEDLEEAKIRLLPRAEVIRRLRELTQPVTLFGEDDLARQSRLRKAEMHHHDRQMSTSGTANVYDRISKKVEMELLEATSLGQEDEVESRDGQAAKSSQRESLIPEKYLVSKKREECESVEEYVYHFFKRLLYEWEDALASRSVEVKRSILGRDEAAKQKQCKEYIKPFFSLLQKKNVPADILKNVEAIVTLAMDREYLKANDMYLRMSIGNAPWPMGVTMVGIHERSARERIHSDQVAHVLNDETQRKYIQSMKRLLTFAQSKYPNSIRTKNVG